MRQTTNQTVKTRLKTVSPSEQQLRVEVARERVTASYDDVYRDIQKEAALPGFRRGKAPRDLLERHHAEKAREEVIRRVVSASLEEAIKQERVQVAGRVTVSDIKLEDSAGLTYNATIEVAPTFKLGRYKGIALQRSPVAVTDEDMQQVLARLQELHAEEVPVAGSEQKEKRLPALDDEFAKDVGVGSLQELKDRVKQDLTAQKEAQVRRQLEEALCAELLKRMDFEVPKSLIERRTEQLKRDFLMRLLMQGVKEAELPEKLKPVEVQLSANAAKLVKLAFLLARIAEAEHLEVTTEESNQELQRLAERWRCSLEQARTHLESERLWESFHQELLQNKTVSWLLEHAQIKTVTA